MLALRSSFASLQHSLAMLMITVDVTDVGDDLTVGSLEIAKSRLQRFFGDDDDVKFEVAPLHYVSRRLGPLFMFRALSPTASSHSH